MITVEQIRAVALFREAHDVVSARGIADTRIVRHQVVRHIIDRCTRALLASTLENLAAARVETVDDVRRVGRRLVAYDAGDGGAACAS